MPTLTETPCPWCHKGRIIAHGPTEPWDVEEPTDPSESRMAGKRAMRFRVAPIEWFSCSRCCMEGTRQYLAAVLATRRPTYDRHGSPAVVSGRLHPA